MELPLTRREYLRWIAVSLAFGQVGCATTREILDKRPEGKWVLAEFEDIPKRPESKWVMAEFDRYAKMADQLRKNHASGPLDEGSVRDLLRKLGVSPAPKPRPDTPPPPPAKPFPVPVYSGGYRWPLDAGVVSSEFGERRSTPHLGIDLAAELRVPVYAAAEGEAIYVGDKLGGYGNLVILRHDQRTTTLYAHNSEFKVKTGQKVRADQVVALLGSTGGYFHGPALPLRDP